MYYPSSVKVGLDEVSTLFGPTEMQYMCGVIFVTGGELLKYTYTLFGGNYCLNGQKTKSGRKKKSLLFWGF